MSGLEPPTPELCLGLPPDRAAEVQIARISTLALDARLLLRAHGFAPVTDQQRMSIPIPGAGVAVNTFDLLAFLYAGILAILERAGHIELSSRPEGPWIRPTEVGGFPTSIDEIPTVDFGRSVGRTVTSYEPLVRHLVVKWMDGSLLEEDRAPP